MNPKLNSEATKRAPAEAARTSTVALLTLDIAHRGLDVARADCALLSTASQGAVTQ